MTQHTVSSVLPQSTLSLVTTSEIQTLGSFVKDRRELLGLTLTALAENASLTKSELSAIERGKIGLPGADKRRRLAKALGVSHLQILIEAGEITQAELGTVAGIVEQDPTDPRLELVQLVKQIRLTEDRTDGLRALLRGWLERDQESRG